MVVTVRGKLLYDLHKNQSEIQLNWFSFILIFIFSSTRATHCPLYTYFFQTHISILWWLTVFDRFNSIFYFCIIIIIVKCLNGSLNKGGTQKMLKGNNRSILIFLSTCFNIYSNLVFRAWHSSLCQILFTKQHFFCNSFLAVKKLVALFISATIHRLKLI